MWDLCIYVSCVLSGMSSRIALTGAIFKKVLELNLTTIGQVSIGKIVNLAAYDVQRLDKVCRRKLCVCVFATWQFSVGLVLNTCSFISSSGFCVLDLLHFDSSTCHYRDSCAVVLHWSRPQLTGGNGCSADADSNAVSLWKAVRQTEVRKGSTQSTASFQVAYILYGRIQICIKLCFIKYLLFYTSIPHCALYIPVYHYERACLHTI